MHSAFHLSAVTTASFVMVCSAPGVLAATNVAVNGGFETGDTSGWTAFPTANSTFGVTGDASAGSFGGLVDNNQLASGFVVKQANIGIGTVFPGAKIDISFDAKGNFADGGVGIAEFFSELSGGGTSSSEILSGGPLFVSSVTDYQSFSFSTVAGPDVSGGITLQFVAANGGAATSVAELFIDNVVINVIPSPHAASGGLLGVGALLFSRRRRLLAG